MSKSPARQLAYKLSALLERLGLLPKWIDAKVREMADNLIVTTRYKSILDTISDYKFQIDTMIHAAGSISPLEMSVNLSIKPVGQLIIGFQAKRHLTYSRDSFTGKGWLYYPCNG